MIESIDLLRLDPSEISKNDTKDKLMSKIASSSLAENNLYSIVINDSERIGYILFLLINGKKSIRSLYILPNHRGKGYSRIIYNSFFSEGESEIYLDPNYDGYELMKSLAESLGYSKSKNEDIKYEKLGKLD